MAGRVGMSQTAVSRARRTFGLHPHRAETFKLSSDTAALRRVYQSAKQSAEFGKRDWAESNAAVFGSPLQGAMSASPGIRWGAAQMPHRTFGVTYPYERPCPAVEQGSAHQG